MHDRHHQEEQHMPSCCQLDAITIKTMILCLFQLRGAQKHLIKDRHCRDHRIYAELLSQMQAWVQEQIDLFYIDFFGKMVLVFEHFSLQMIFRNELNSATEVP